METLWQDVKYGVRMLAKSPGFALVAVLTLALGIGANTAIFSVVNATLWRAGPYAEPDHLVRLFEARAGDTQLSEQMEVAPANFFDWRRESRTLSDLAAYGAGKVAFASRREPQQVSWAFVSANFFSLLGVPPASGRTFTVDEDQPGRDRVAILSYGFWQRTFGGEAEAVGKTCSIDGSLYTVIGVMPADFQYPDRTDVWVPLALNKNQLVMREAHFLRVIARKQSANSLEAVRAEMTAIAQRLAERYPATNKSWVVTVVPLAEFEVRDVRRALLILLGAVGLVLLIACANVASLLLVRATARSGEMAVRLALGATRWRIVRQLLTEGTLLAVLGGALGFLACVWGADSLSAVSHSTSVRADAIAIDGRVLTFAVLLTVITGVLFSLAPALQVSRTRIHERLKESGQRAAGPMGRLRSLQALVISQVALALVMLIATGLLVHSFIKLWGVDTGIQPENVLVAEVNLPSARYDGPDSRAQRLAFYDQAIHRIASLPGVTAVGAVESVPLTPHARQWTFRRDGENAAPSERPSARFQVVTAGYFQTVGMSVKRGRAFSDADRDESPRVMIVNEAFVRRFFPIEDPLGKRIVIRNEPMPREIVGVVNDVRQAGLDRLPSPEMYVPYGQLAIGAVPLVVRGSAPAAELGRAIRAEVRMVDPDVVIARIRSMPELMADSVAERRLALVSIASFAAVGIAMTAIGIYAVISYAVGCRIREIGIRMALGAQRSDVLRMVLADGVRLWLPGVAVGIAGALAATRLMSSLLYGVGAMDPVTFVAAPLLLAGVAVLATVVPARRAMRVDPMVALRDE